MNIKTHVKYNVVILCSTHP